MGFRHVLAVGAIGVATLVCATAPLDAASGRPLHARLHPVVGKGSGTFTGTASSSKSLVQVTWTIAVSHLSGKATQAVLQSGGAHSVALPLCAPCRAPIGGRLAVTAALWSRLRSGSPRVVVSTRAHPSGELSGALTIG